MKPAAGRLRLSGPALALFLSACGSPPAEATFTVSGMFCPECPASVAETVRELPGVEEVSVTYPEGKMVVVYDAEKITPQAIAAAVDERGYGAKPVGRKP